MAIIAFLGKGGSGKSTLSYRFIKYLEQNKKTVLAVDADHNMDLSFNLGMDEPINYIGQSLEDLLIHSGLPKESSYRDIVDLNLDPKFSLSPTDPFTTKYTKEISNNLRLMIAGPHNDDVLYDKNCSHTLSTPLKIYLPYLNLGPDQYVVVDEKAGSDGAGTGVASGFSFALVCAEPTPHGIKAAHQIAEILEFYGTPYEFVLNKVQDTQDINDLEKMFKKAPLFSFEYKKEFVRPDQELSGKESTEFKKILSHIDSELKTGDTRKERSIAKFQKNKEYKQKTT